MERDPGGEEMPQDESAAFTLPAAGVRAAARDGEPPGPPPRRIGNQLGALCFRRTEGRVEVLLVTSRTTGRWVVPKGWPMPGRSLAEAARIEAWEEAGARGKVSAASLGLYSYIKRADDRWPHDTPCVVALYPLKVRELARHYPERHQRRRAWFTPDEAAGLVEEPELAGLIRDFRPGLYFGPAAGQGPAKD